VEIRLLRADEAPALVRCFERCYGKTYVAADFYDAARIHARLTSGWLRSVVAVDPGEGVVGHMALALREPDGLTCDAGNTVVDPRYRGHALAAKMAARLVALCREGGFVGFHHYPTTAHPVMQKLAVDGGGIETGLMLGYIPAGTEYRELAEGGSASRLAVVIVYQPIADAPARDVFVPERQRALIERAYAEAKLTRTLRTPAAALEPFESRLDVEHDPRRGLLRVTIARAGADLSEQVRVALRSHAAEVQQVDIPLGDATSACAVDALRALGFFNSGLLPEYRAGDVLRLQRLEHPSPEVLAPTLATAGGRALLDTISSDRAM
jgi:hypothetical protein